MERNCHRPYDRTGHCLPAFDRAVHPFGKLLFRLSTAGRPDATGNSYICAADGSIIAF